MRRLVSLAAGTILAVLVGTEASAVTTRVVARTLMPREITDFKLPNTTQRATGLLTIGVGTPAYLEVQVPADATVSGSVTWSLTAPTGGTASLVASRLDTVLGGAGAPIYTPGESALYKVASRRVLLPNAAGQWRITAQLNLLSAAGADSAVTAPQVVTSANYVGVGGIDSAAVTFPQCALCHADKAETWAETPHAELFTVGINGGAEGSHYSSNCIRCHTVGYDTTATANNGAFDDVARQLAWTFPTPGPGQWAALPAALKAKANIQCESCHGPGSEHAGNPADNRISSTMDAGVCAYCHASGTNHHHPQEWRNSLHANAVVESSTTCVICHSGAGFVERLEKGLDITQSDYATHVENTSYEAISCQTCHDPHVEDADHPLQLRTVADVTLINGQVVTEGGNGKLCMNCHKARRGGDEYAATYHSRHNPHGSPQTDMLVGTGAAEYGRTIRSSSHLYAVEGACVGCHMQDVNSPDPLFTHAGGHTFAVSYNGQDLTTACANCHGPMTSFDIPKSDYDGDGRVEGVQTEIEGLLATLGNALPPDGPTVAASTSYTTKQLKAAFNHAYVVNDGSRGIHNTQYAVGILQASIQDVTGRAITSRGTVRTYSGTADRRHLVASASGAGGYRVGKLAQDGQPDIYGLYQNGPNPFNPETEISYVVPEPVGVRITIYNTLGQQVRTLVDAHHPPGDYSVNWDATDANGQKVTGGMYIYTMEAGSFVGSGKMVLLP